MSSGLINTFIRLEEQGVNTEGFDPDDFSDANADKSISGGISNAGSVMITGTETAFDLVLSAVSSPSLSESVLALLMTRLEYVLDPRGAAFRFDF